MIRPRRPKAPRVSVRLRGIRRGLATVLMVGLILGGCGIKKGPQLPEVDTPQGVKDLRAAVAGEDILLEWTTAGLKWQGDRAAQGFYVYRADEAVDAQACKGCPLLFRRVGLVKIYRELAPDEVLNYREPKRAGVRYTFKVVAYNAQGLLGADSNLTRLTTD